MKKLSVLLLALLLIATGCFSEKNETTENKTKAVKAATYPSKYSTMNLRGTCNNWGTTAMTLVSDYTWSVTATFGNTTTERFKFDATTNWGTNFGDNNKDKIADINGSDIPVTAGKTYEITFNDNTKAYSVTEKTVSVRDINIYGILDGMGAGINYSFLKVNLYKTTAPGIVVQSGYFSGPECAKIFRGLEQSTSYIASISQFDEITATFYTGGVGFTTSIENKYQPSQSINIIKTQSAISTRIHGFLNGIPSSQLLGMTVKLYKSSDLNTVIQSAQLYGKEIDVNFSKLSPSTQYKAVIFEPSQYTIATGEVSFTTGAENVIQPAQNINVTVAANNISTRIHGFLNGIPASSELYNKTVKLYKASDLNTVVQSGQLYGKEMDVNFTGLLPSTQYKAVMNETSGALQYTGEVTFTTNSLNQTQPSQSLNVVSSVIADKTVYVYTKIKAVNFTANPGIESIARDLSVELYKGTTLVSKGTISGTSIIGVNFAKLDRGTTYTLKLPTQSKYESNPALITGNVKYTASDVTFTTPSDSTQLATIIWTLNAELSTSYAKTYSQIYFRGTPNGWLTTAMTLVADYTWSITVTTGSTSAERFKFDATTSWATNWGDTNKDFIADSNGSDIALLANTKYTITFNDKTKAYTVTKN